MARVNIYLPDRLAAETQHLQNVSAICQRALRAEIDDRPQVEATITQQLAESRGMWMEEAEKWKGQAEKYRAALERIARLSVREHDDGRADLIAREALS